MHSFHLVKVPLAVTARTLLSPPAPADIPGLRHIECMTTMELGSPIVSPGRAQVQNLAVFAGWDDEADLDAFLDQSALGATLHSGWHVRLEFMRRWGHVASLGDLPTSVGEQEADQPVVAVTLARLKIPQVPRFIRWGKPVETLVRDDPATTLALAAFRPPRTVSTFTVWTSLQAMTDMVHGRAEMDGTDRHAAAMVERRRKDFHFEFTTLRYRCLSEHGEWAGRRSIVPPSTVPPGS